MHKKPVATSEAWRRKRLADLLAGLTDREGLQPELNPSHCHIEAGLFRGLVLGRKQALGLCEVISSQAEALARLAILGVKASAVPLIHPIPLAHGYVSMLQRLERLDPLPLGSVRTVSPNIRELAQANPIGVNSGVI